MTNVYDFTVCDSPLKSAVRRCRSCKRQLKSSDFDRLLFKHNRDHCSKCRLLRSQAGASVHLYNRSYINGLENFSSGCLDVVSQVDQEDFNLRHVWFSSRYGTEFCRSSISEREVFDAYSDVCIKKHMSRRLKEITQGELPSAQGLIDLFTSVRRSIYGDARSLVEQTADWIYSSYRLLKKWLEEVKAFVLKTCKSISDTFAGWALTIATAASCFYKWASELPSRLKNLWFFIASFCTSQDEKEVCEKLASQCEEEEKAELENYVLAQSGNESSLETRDNILTRLVNMFYRAISLEEDSQKVVSKKKDRTYRPHSFKNWCDAVRAISGLKISLKELGMHDYMKQLVEYCYYTITGIQAPWFEEAVAAWVVVTRELDSEFKLAREVINLPRSHQRKISDLMGQLDSLYPVVLACDKVKHAYYTALYKMYELKSADFCASVRGSQRVKPVVIVLSGPSAVGKSSVVSNLVTDVMPNVNQLLADKLDMMSGTLLAEHSQGSSSFTVNCMKPPPEFDEGYHDPVFFNLNELYTVKSDKDKGEWASRFMQYIDDLPLLKNKAFADKGKDYFNSPFVTATGNFDAHPEVVNDPTAYYRRIELDLKVSSTVEPGGIPNHLLHSKFTFTQQMIDVLTRKLHPSPFLQSVYNSHPSLFSEGFGYRRLLELICMIYIDRITSAAACNTRQPFILGGDVKKHQVPSWVKDSYREDALYWGRYDTPKMMSDVTLQVAAHNVYELRKKVVKKWCEIDQIKDEVKPQAQMKVIAVPDPIAKWEKDIADIHLRLMTKKIPLAALTLRSVTGNMYKFLGERVNAGARELHKLDNVNVFAMYYKFVRRLPAYRELFARAVSIENALVGQLRKDVKSAVVYINKASAEIAGFAMQMIIEFKKDPDEFLHEARICQDEMSSASLQQFRRMAWQDFKLPTNSTGMVFEHTTEAKRRYNARVAQNKHRISDQNLVRNRERDQAREATKPRSAPVPAPVVRKKVNKDKKRTQAMAQARGRKAEAQVLNEDLKNAFLNSLANLTLGISSVQTVFLRNTIELFQSDKVDGFDVGEKFFSPHHWYNFVSSKKDSDEALIESIEKKLVLLLYRYPKTLSKILFLIYRYHEVEDAPSFSILVSKVLVWWSGAMKTHAKAFADDIVEINLNQMVLKMEKSLSLNRCVSQWANFSVIVGSLLASLLDLEHFAVQNFVHNSLVGDDLWLDGPAIMVPMSRIDSVGAKAVLAKLNCVGYHSWWLKEGNVKGQFKERDIYKALRDVVVGIGLTILGWAAARLLWEGGVRIAQAVSTSRGSTYSWSMDDSSLLDKAKSIEKAGFSVVSQSTYPVSKEKIVVAKSELSHVKQKVFGQVGGVLDTTLEKIKANTYAIYSTLSEAKIATTWFLGGEFACFSKHVWDGLPEDCTLISFVAKEREIPLIQICKSKCTVISNSVLPLLLGTEVVVVRVPCGRLHQHVVKHIWSKDSKTRQTDLAKAIISYWDKDICGGNVALLNDAFVAHGASQEITIAGRCGERTYFLSEPVCYKWTQNQAGASGSPGMVFEEGRWKICFNHDAAMATTGAAFGQAVYCEMFDGLFDVKNTRLQCEAPVYSQICVDFEHDPIDRSYFYDYERNSYRGTNTVIPSDVTMFREVDFIPRDSFLRQCVAPACLTMDAYNIAREKERSYDKVHFQPHEVLKDAVDYGPNVIDKLMCGSQMNKGCQTYTVEEALFTPDLNPFDKQTSRGPRLTARNWPKDKILNKDVEFYPKFCVLVMAYVALFKSGTFTLQVAFDKLKDETRDISRVLAKKTRIFNVVDFVDNVLQKMAMGMLVARTKHLFAVNPMACGIDPRSRMWAQIYRTFKGRRVIFADVSGFDYTHKQWVLLIVWLLIDSSYSDPFSKQFAYWACWSCVHAVRFCRSSGRLLYRGNSSGNWLTTWLNTVFNLCYFCMCVAHYARKYGEDPAVAIKELVIKLYSDDNITSLEREWWTPENVSIYFEGVLGITLTGVDKSVLTAANASGVIEDVQFLSRSFRPTAWGVFAPLEVSNLMAQLHYVRAPKTADSVYVRVQLQQNLNSVVAELSEFEEGEACRVYAELQRILSTPLGRRQQLCLPPLVLDREVKYANYA